MDNLQAFDEHTFFNIMWVTILNRPVAEISKGITVLEQPGLHDAFLHKNWDCTPSSYWAKV